MTRDQWQGRIEVAIGAVKEFTGALLRSRALQSRGQRERTLGHARASHGNAVAGVVRRSH